MSASTATARPAGGWTAARSTRARSGRCGIRRRWPSASPRSPRMPGRLAGTPADEDRGRAGPAPMARRPPAGRGTRRRAPGPAGGHARQLGAVVVAGAVVAGVAVLGCEVTVGPLADVDDVGAVVAPQPPHPSTARPWRAQEPAGVEPDAGGQARREQLGRGGTQVRATSLHRLVHRQAMAAYVDLVGVRVQVGDREPDGLHLPDSRTGSTSCGGSATATFAFPERRKDHGNAAATTTRGGNREEPDRQPTRRGRRVGSGWSARRRGRAGRPGDRR